MSFTSKCTCGYTLTMGICDGNGDGKCQRKIEDIQSTPLLEKLNVRYNGVDYVVDLSDCSTVQEAANKIRKELPMIDVQIIKPEPDGK